MNLASDLVDTLPICQAKSKQSGQRCKNYATKGKRVCRIHGGKSTGIRTKEGKLRWKGANTKHGLRTKEALAERKETRKMIKEAKSLINSVR